jgi:hypothetical protein
LIRIIRNWLVIITFGVNFFSHPYLRWNVLNKGWYKMEIFFFEKLWMNYGLWLCAKKKTWNKGFKAFKHPYIHKSFVNVFLRAMWKCDLQVPLDRQENGHEINEIFCCYN